MAASNRVPMQQYRGPRASMPSSALHGELLITSDTNEIFVGTGTSVVPLSSNKIIQIPNPTTTWTILHNMARRPAVTTVDVNGNQIDGEIVYNSDQQITIYFSPAVAGTVYLN